MSKKPNLEQHPAPFGLDRIVFFSDAVMAIVISTSTAGTPSRRSRMASYSEKGAHLA